MKEPRILAIDPGDVYSAWVEYEAGDPGTVIDFGMTNNMAFIELLDDSLLRRCPDAVAIEMIMSYGQVVGQTVHDTTFWTGRFYEAAVRSVPCVMMIGRKQAVMTLCDTGAVGDAGVKTALCDRFGGDLKTVKGTSKNPGPLFGIKEDVWSALAIAVTAATILGGSTDKRKGWEWPHLKPLRVDDAAMDYRRARPK